MGRKAKAAEGERTAPAAPAAAPPAAVAQAVEPPAPAPPVVVVATPRAVSEAFAPPAPAPASALAVVLPAAVAVAPVSAAVAAGATAPSSADDKPLILRAAALRAKYALPGGLRRIVPDQLGFHPCNRDGQPPNAERCNELCQRILEIGFDAAEADGGGVCVQEVPQQATIARFNSAVADGDPEFAAMNSEVLPYGTLSHSHLNQILKNLLCEARGRVPQLCGPDGRFKMSLLQWRDSAFAKAAMEGLLW